MSAKQNLAVAQRAASLAGLKNSIASIKKVITDGLPAQPQQGLEAITAAELLAPLDTAERAYLDGIIAKHDELTAA